MRRVFDSLVAAGGYPCARCGKLIEPDEPWDLAHVDGDRSRYSGPGHRARNRAATRETAYVSRLVSPPRLVTCSRLERRIFSALRRASSASRFIVARRRAARSAYARPL